MTTTRHTVRLVPTTPETHGYGTHTAECSCGWDRISLTDEAARTDGLAHLRDALQGYPDARALTPAELAVLRAVLDRKAC